MAEGKEIVIRIVNSGQQSKKIDTTQTQKDSSTSQTEKSTDDIFKNITVAYLYKKIKSSFPARMAVQETKYQLNKYFNLTDNYLGQQNMNIALSAIGKVADIGTSMLAGFKIGGVPGAVLALGTSVVSTAVQVSHNYEQEMINLNKMNAQLQFNRERAGYSLTAGSVGENR